MHNYPVKHVTRGMNFVLYSLVFSCATCEFWREFPAAPREGLEQYGPPPPVDLEAVHPRGQQRDFAALKGELEREQNYGNLVAILHRNAFHRWKGTM